MNAKTSKLLTAALLVYCIWNASSLFNLSGIRFESYGLVPLLIWIFPLFFYLVPRPNQFGGNPYLLGVALFISFMSTIVELNILAHLALALALIGLVPLSFAMLPWYLSASGWMPAFSYFGAHYFPNAVVPLRFIIPFLGSLWGTWILYKRQS